MACAAILAQSSEMEKGDGSRAGMRRAAPSGQDGDVTRDCMFQAALPVEGAIDAVGQFKARDATEARLMTLQVSSG
jgi:hypothetical protein